MFRHWVCIVMLSLIGSPLWAQNDKAIKREREEMISEQRVALVIGNGKYKHIDALKNPVNDAHAMAEALSVCDFTVSMHTNLDLDSLNTVVYKFGQMIKRGGVGLLYYSGHGIQVDGENYLVPVNAKIQEEYQIKTRCLNMKEVLEAMKVAGNRVNILILDACRDNPFANRFRSSGSGGGLAKMAAPTGTFIAYATAPGDVAKDGDGFNSPFTAALVEKMHTPGLSIGDLFIDIRNRVRFATNQRQTTWDASSLTGKFYFRLPSNPPPPPVPPRQKDNDNIPSPSPLSLHEAAGLNRTEEVLRRLMGGVKVNTQDYAGQTPLHTAVRFNARETAEVLLNQHADVNFQDNVGQTPLHIAARYKADQVAELLLQQGAVVNVRDNRGRTPLDIANSSQAEGIIKVLRRYSDSGVETLEVGRTFKDCGECPEMVVIPSGSFMMGSPSSEKDRDDNEGPLHRVRIDYRFAVGVYEVTFAEWEACVNAGGCGGYRPSDRGWGRGNRPVINVFWEDAQSYVRWLSAKTGHQYSLLSESEWEYVARAGTTTPFYFGSTISTDQANYNGNDTYGTGRKGMYREKTLPVGSFKENAWGVYDMHGNVEEWVQDCYNDSYVGAPTDGSAWELGNCVRRVLRGGGWSSLPSNVRSAHRFGFSGNVRSAHRSRKTTFFVFGTGFRVLRRF